MTIQKRIPNPVKPIWVALSVAAIGGMAFGFYKMKKSEDEGAPEPDAEIFPPSAWNTEGPDATGVVQVATAGELYKAVFTGPLIDQGEMGLGDIPAYAIEYVPGEAFTVHDVEYETIYNNEGEKVGSQVEVLFTPRTVDGADTTPALIRATAPVPAGTFRQLHLEIER